MTDIHDILRADNTCEVQQTDYLMGIVLFQKLKADGSAGEQVPGQFSGGNMTFTPDMAETARFPGTAVIVQPPQGNPAIRLLVVDGHPLVRWALSHISDDAPDLRAAGEASSAAEAINQVFSLKPDVGVEANGTRRRVSQMGPAGEDQGMVQQIHRAEVSPAVRQFASEGVAARDEDIQHV